MRVLPALIALTLLAPMAAAPPPAPAPVHRIEQVTADSYCIFGQGGNIGLVVTARHAVLIDSQFEPLVPGLLETVRTVTDKPVKYLINTHVHGDHTGGNRALASQVTAIIAHANVRRRLEAEQAKLPPAQRGGLPELLLGSQDAAEQARLDIHLDDTDLHLVHRGPAHTDGDVIVGVPGTRMLHMGDLFFNGILPFVDTERGGSFDGLVSQLDWLASWVPEDVKIIPGHGPVCGKAQLLRYRDFLKAVQAHVKTHPGLDPRALAAGFDQAAWPGWKPTPTFVTWETLFAAASGQGPGRVKSPA